MRIKRIAAVLCLFLLLAGCGHIGSEPIEHTETSLAEITDEPSVTQYPRGIPEEWLDDVAELPGSVFGSGLQNDMIANVYSAQGKVLDFSAFIDGGMYYTFVLETEQGPVRFIDASGIIEGDPKYASLMEDDTTNYHKPLEGSKANVVGVYSGYDWENDMPVLSYGASHVLALLIPTKYLDEPYDVTEEDAEDLAEVTSELDELATYPINSTSKYLAEASEPPDIIWSTTGEENGLIGSIFTISGTVTDEGEVSISDYTDVGYIIVETSDGPVMIADMYNGLRSEFEAVGEAASFALFVEEPGADYTLPSVGVNARFVCLYQGYSNQLDMPALYLGSNEYLVDLTRDQAVPEETPNVDTVEYRTRNTAPDQTPEPTPEPTEEPEPTPEPTPTPAPTHDYVLNTNTKKFHKPSCSSVSKMKNSNKQYYTGTRDEVLAMGYDPCGNCNP